ncbi:MFS transporter [Eisenbergiella sp.]
MKNSIKRLKTFLILWSTQSLSQLGSAMTNFALMLWMYEKTGSALQTSLLGICSYAPYVMMSIFAGVLSDRWDKKRTMLVCDSFAACTTLIVLVLLKNDLLCPVHLYVLNAVNGLMNTIQQPAGDVSMTLIIDKEDYQKTSGLRSFSQSLVTIVNPIAATAFFSLFGIEAVIFIDLATFAAAFITLLLFIRIPKLPQDEGFQKESLFDAAKVGLTYLKENPMILCLILFLAGVNLVASAFDAVLPAYILPRENGGEAVLGIATSCAGMATLVGSMIVTVLPKPGNRIKVIYLTMLFSLGTENFMLAFSQEPFLWYLSQIVGWIVVPVMGANLDVVLRATIPVQMQGRVYSCRNTLQFFTIPIGYLIGGFMVDEVCEPLIAAASGDSLVRRAFGAQKGSGAAMMMFILGVSGVLFCLLFGKILKKYHFKE